MFGQRLTHSNKVLILVLVPLLFELGLMAWLYNLLQESEQEAQRAEHARIITRHINRFHQLVMSAAAGISGTAISEELLGPGAHNRMERSFWKELEEIEKFVTPKSDEAALVGQMRDCVLTSITDLEQIQKTMKEGDLSDRIAQLKKVRHLLSNVTSQSEKLLQYEEEIQESSPKLQQKNRTSIKELLLAGAAGNILIVCVLAHLFNKTTSQRLTVLQENSTRLANRQPLSPPISGEDEIAQVDHAFHQMVEKLTRIERMKQEFVAMVSHDLRTPLTSIKGVLALISEGAVKADSEKGQQRLQYADQSLDNLIKMITDLLDIEKLEAGMFKMEFAGADMQEVIEGAAQSVYTFADRNGIAIKTETKNVAVEMDADRIRQVMINLLSNAVKFSSSGSVVTASCASVDDFVEVHVSDTGRGIPRDQQEAIFERFKQVESEDGKERSGTGLGLAICKLIVEGHGGSIGVKSKPGEGSNFWFKLPLRRVAASAPAIGSNIAPHPHV